MQGSIVKRLMQYECNSAHAEDEWLVSTHLLEQSEQMVVDLQKELKWLKVERDNLHEKSGHMSTERVEPVSLISASKLPVKAEDKVKSKLPRLSSSAEESETTPSLPEHSSDNHDKGGSGDKSRSRNHTRGNCPHPQNFAAEWRNLVGGQGIVISSCGSKTLKKLPEIVAGLRINMHSGSHGLLRVLPRPHGTEH